MFCEFSSATYFFAHHQTTHLTAFASVAIIAVVANFCIACSNLSLNTFVHTSRTCPASIYTLCSIELHINATATLVMFVCGCIPSCTKCWNWNNCCYGKELENLLIYWFEHRRRQQMAELIFCSECFFFAHFCCGRWRHLHEEAFYVIVFIYFAFLPAIHSVSFLVDRWFFNSYLSNEFR